MDKPFLKQYLNQWGNTGGRLFYQLKKENGVLTALAPNDDNSFFQEVVPGDREIPSAGLGFVEYRWTFPVTDASKPTLVTFVSHASSLVRTIATTGNTLVVRYDIIDTTGQGRFGNGYRRYLSINGERVEEQYWLSEILVPGFESPYSGLHRFEFERFEVGNPSQSGTFAYEYDQKTLRFAEPFPNYDLESAQPLQISNNIEWSNGAPVDNARWKVEVDHRAKTGLGTVISSTWNPSERVLARRSRQTGSRPHAPTDIRPQSELEPLLYNVSARATGLQYDSKNSLDYQVSSHGEVPGKRGELMILDERVSPEPPFEEPDSSVTLTATVVTVASNVDPASIEWTVDIEDPDGNTVFQDLAMGAGPYVAAQWDGTINGQPVEHPTDYKFDIQAFACGGGGPPASRRVSGQVSSGGCLHDQKEVAMMDIATEYLRVSVNPDRVRPSDIIPGEVNEANVQVELLKMPPGHTDLLVRLKAEVFRDPSRPDSDLRYRGGHNHEESTRPPATFTTDSYRFGKPGVFKTKLQAPVAGARLKIFATPDDQSVKPATCQLLVEVSGLQRLVGFHENQIVVGYMLIGGDGADNQLPPSVKPNIPEHPSNHWGTAEMLEAIDRVSLKYMMRKMEKFRDQPDRLPTRAEKLLVNDIALPRGGVFDAKLFNWSNPHSEHRAGVVADVSAGPEAATGGNQTDQAFVKLWYDETGTEAYVEGDHLHIRLTEERI